MDFGVVFFLLGVASFFEADFFFFAAVFAEGVESASGVSLGFAFAFGVASSSAAALCFFDFDFGVGDFRGLGEGLFFALCLEDFGLADGLGDSSAAADDSDCAS